MSKIMTSAEFMAQRTEPTFYSSHYIHDLMDDYAAYVVRHKTQPVTQPNLGFYTEVCNATSEDRLQDVCHHYKKDCKSVRRIIDKERMKAEFADSPPSIEIVNSNIVVKLKEKGL